MHESAEQAVVHPEMQQLDDAVAEERLEEETKGDELLERLRSMDVDDPEFDGLFARFRDAVLRHADHEEREEHPKLRTGVDADRLTEMADEFVAAERDADPYVDPATVDPDAPALSLIDEHEDAVEPNEPG